MAAQTAGAELRGGELAGAGRSAATGARLGRGLVQKDELGMGGPLGYLGRWCGTGGSGLADMSGSAVVENAGELGSKHQSTLQAELPSAKESRRLWVAY